MYLAGVPESFDALAITELFEKTKRSFLLITSSTSDSERLYDDIARLTGEEHLALFSEGSKQSVVKQELHKHTAEAEANAQMLDALERISAAKEPLIILAPAASLGLPLPSKESFAKDSITLKRGDEAGYDVLSWWLKERHFEQKQFVESNGDFAVRGGIIDIFPYTESVPIRVEFFGDTIESIREFDQISQRSIAHREEIAIVSNVLADDAVSRASSLFDYLPKDIVIVTANVAVGLGELEERGQADLVEKIESSAHLILSPFSPSDAVTVEFGVRKPQSFNANLKIIREHLHSLLNDDFHVYILAESKDLTKRLEDLLDSDEAIHEASDQDVVLSDVEEEKLKKGRVTYLVPSLSHGFVFPQATKTVVYAEHELFGRKRERGASSKRRAARSKGISMRELRSLRRGDLLVHEDKGIGKFMGLDTIEVRGSKQEVVRLQYRDNDFLYINLDYIAKLSKYSAAEVDESAIKLSKLGSAEWQRTKEKTKKRLKDIARDLIKLYAKRKSIEGFAFSKDDIIQREMEAAFLYDDTPDQAKATEDLKRDMELPSPMDRLVCGDVGYGKTEVAMRAAMKATIDKKQVAVLVPTTILAEQHARSFTDRLEKFGVAVAAISRFRSAKEQKEILVKLAEGKIDVLIGTHRLLSKDVIFRDIGLLVIDEEHRFGVAAKEKLRHLRANIDTLTLTATPIPRTLNFSLLGARDLSVIETPPKNRLPIATEILGGMDDDVIRKAIQREMERGGQMYAINDKVGDIELLAIKLRELVPRARTGVVHGQMPATQIEKAMRDFLERKIDILCATKIVESGLDVPNANTIIINRAHNFGLAELYQLRGRVGRSNEQAYCYLITNPIKTLSKDSLRRLEAMEEYSDLGAGFQLAMRDLEIRGAGNLLGAEQSGFINEIGFDLFQKTLAEAVDELKEEEFKDLFKNLPQTKSRNAFIRKRAEDSDDVNVSLGVDSLIPEHYLEDDAERFGFYQKMATAENDAALEEISNELKDRFGALPEEVLNLIAVARVRMLAKKLGFRVVAFDDATRTLRISLPKEDQSEYYRNFFPQLIDSFGRIGESRVRLINEPKGMRLVVKMLAKEKGSLLLAEIIETLKSLIPIEVTT